MAKGLAVVSGSSDVVFKALETGVITLGSAATDAEVTITGSLVINKHADGTDPLVITGLSSSATSDPADKILVIDATTGVVREAEKLDSDDVYFTGSSQTLSEFSASIVSQLGASSLTVSGAANGVSVDLDTEFVKFVGTNNEVVITVNDEGGNAVVTASLPTNVTVQGYLSANELTASNGLLVSLGGADITGNTTVVGTLSASSNLSSGGDLTIAGSGSIAGDLTVDGDLLVQGSVTTIDTQNLTVKDAIILVGSGSDASSADLGFVFGTTSNRGFSVEGGEFFLGTTSADASGVNIDVTDNGILNLGALSASVGVDAAQASITNNLTVGGTTTLNGSVVLGDAGTDSITVNGYITGSGSPIIVSSSLTIGDAGNVNNEVTTFVSQVRMPIYTISGDALEGTFPAIPSAYISSPTAQGGHMFYLTASTNVGLGDDSVFPEANKWYMNERGVWHESFFFVG